MNKKEVKKAPALRFKGFTNDWEQRKLGCLMNITSVKRIHQSDWRKKGIPFYRARDITALSKNLNIEEPIFISRDLYEEYSKISGKVQINDLLVTGVGTIGVPLLVQTVPLYFKDGNIIWFQNSNKLIGLFFLYLFKTNTVQKYIHTTTGVGTVPTYTIQSGKNTPVYITSKKEQKDIGTIFQLIDNLISLQQRKLQLLKRRKQGLLQRIFSQEKIFKHIRLGDIAKFQKGKGLNKKDLLTKGKYKVIHYADLYKFSPVQDHVLHFINDISANSPISANSLLFPSSDVTSTGLARTSTLAQNNVYAGSDIIIANLNSKKANSIFLSYEINFFKHRIIPLITGTTIRHIYVSDLEKLKINLPNKNLQDRYSLIFYRFDEIERNIEKEILNLKQFKKFLLQNMFI